MTGQPSPPKNAARTNGRDQRWRVPVVCLMLAAVTFAVFGQTLTHDFVDYDDGDIFDNPVVVRGLTLKGIIWAFSFHSSNWFPLNWLSHMLDCQIYGLHPGGHHLTNVLLHTATALALFLVLRHMTGAFWRSAFVAAVFAIHPLRVESVAWVAERKDVLSGLFFMLTIGAYVRYARRPWSPARYGLVMVLFALGLMCKPMLVTLPVVLLLLDYWPLQRVKTRKYSGLVMEKLPLLALSAAACIATLLAQQTVIQSAGSFSLPYRLGNALATCLVYFGQMVWPAGLAVFYPYPHNGLPAWEVALAGMLVSGLSAIAWVQRRKQPWMLVGWIWYLVMLLPVLGIIQVGSQAHADRYTYLPQIGIYVALTWLMAEWAAKQQVGRVAVGSLMTAVLGALLICALKQTTYWLNSKTLWTHTLDCTTGNDIAHYNLGVVLEREGRADEAIFHYQQALIINPGKANAHNNLGINLLHEGKLDEAIFHYQQALKGDPAFADAHNNLGRALLQQGRVAEAISQFQAASRSDPNLALPHLNLGLALFQEGKVDEAITEYQEALQRKADDAETHFSLGDALRQKGRVDEAITQYQETLQSNPVRVDAHVNLGNLLLQKGRVDEAITHFQRALQSRPDSATAENDLGNAFLQMGNMGQAIAHFQKALQLNPADPSFLNNLAWLLAACPDASLRNGNKALELARKANALTGGENPIILHTLAAACAEAGRFSEALETAQRALQRAGAQSDTRLAGQLQYEMKLYQAGSPFHLPAQTH